MWVVWIHGCVGVWGGTCVGRYLGFEVNWGMCVCKVVDDVILSFSCVTDSTLLYLL